jgi:hypothetical protein
MVKSFRYEILNTSPKSLIRDKRRQCRHGDAVLTGSFRSWKGSRRPTATQTFEMVKNRYSFRFGLAPGRKARP